MFSDSYRRLLWNKFIQSEIVLFSIFFLTISLSCSNGSNNLDHLFEFQFIEQYINVRSLSELNSSSRVSELVSMSATFLSNTRNIRNEYREQRHAIKFPRRQFSFTPNVILPVCSTASDQCFNTMLICSSQRDIWCSRIGAVESCHRAQPASTHGFERSLNFKAARSDQSGCFSGALLTVECKQIRDYAILEQWYSCQYLKGQFWFAGDCNVNPG